TKIDPHHFNAESDLIESLLHRDSSIIYSFSKIDSLLDEFAGELTLPKSISPGIDETDYYSDEDICLTKRFLYDNSSPRPPEEFVSDNSNANIESFSPSPIPIEDSDSFMEEIDLSFMPDDPIIFLSWIFLFSIFTPLDQLKYGGNWVKLNDLKQALHGRHSCVSVV
nr:hypothetical protein [Tanacetum cinerariifolium]